MWIQKEITLAVTLLICVGCPGPLPDRNLKEKLSETDVVGVWHLTPESLDMLNLNHIHIPVRESNSIQILSDGRLIFNSLAASLGSVEVLALEGQWMLREEPGSSSTMKKANYLEIVLDMQPGSMHRGLNFSKDKKGLVLWEFFGDPDSWEFIEYRKK